VTIEAISRSGVSITVERRCGVVGEQTRKRRRGRVISSTTKRLYDKDRRQGQTQLFASKPSSLYDRGCRSRAVFKKASTVPRDFVKAQEGKCLRSGSK
jgi:hypothetical protein